MRVVVAKEPPAERRVGLMAHEALREYMAAHADGGPSRPA